MDKQIKINIPEQLLKEVEARLNESPFVTINDLVLYLMQSYLDAADGQNSASQTREEAEEIKKRLKNLGYL